MNCMSRAVVVAALIASPLALAQGESTRADAGAAAGVSNGVSTDEVRALFGPLGGGAGIIRIDESAFQPGSGLITFSEFPVATENPVYDAADYGGVAGDPQVSFGGFFQGQSLGDAGTCPAGAALTGCVIGDPTGPLTLDPASPATSIRNDGANPTSPVLSGSPIFNGPIAILFDTDVAGVGLDGGFFDAIGGVAITAFARDGSVIGAVLNEEIGIEFLGLVTADNSDSIAGLLFSLVGAEPAGFAIDNVRFGTRGVIAPPGGPGPPPPPPAPPTPVPTVGLTGLAALAIALLLFGWVAVRR